MTVNTDKPYKIFGESIEQGALDQFEAAMQHPCTVRGALMPDAHQGYTLPIGAVIETKGSVFPAYVGYDIGCGVSATKLTIDKTGLDLELIKQEIIKQIPIGFNKYSEKQDLGLSYDKEEFTDQFNKDVESTGKYQLGTLGGGNHFIEIGESENDNTLWIVIHSGSRGLGHKTATRYMKKASVLHNNMKYFDGFDRANYEARNEKFKAHAPEKYEVELKRFLELKEAEYNNRPIDMEGLYYLPLDKPIAAEYMAEMFFCQNYALSNRLRMTSVVVDIIRQQKECEIETMINRNHNHAEVVDGNIIHRKGATHAEKDMMGVIPGNMLDGSFIVKGRGNKESISSSSHGAGRVLSRAQAKKVLDSVEFIDSMRDVVCNSTVENVDEAPKAYKNIFDVMEMQKDLLTVMDRAIPILNVKG